uniref:SLIT and NTRK like family member 5 n=1 Tax=Crocodylus porosus TaxID=8502 RepID=A0A7M4FNQ6_CROPO
MVGVSFFFFLSLSLSFFLVLHPLSLPPPPWLLISSDSIEYYGEICDNACPCEEKDSILTVSCENRGIISLFEISPPRFPVYHLLLSGNLLNRLYPNQFVNYTGASILHLGSNDIQDIETGAFHGLRGLRRLHLNNNKLELLRDDTFLGLESLEYLQVDYNYISVIEPNAFSKLHLLQVLILNDNLLSGLPNNLFRFVPLTHLDLRGNLVELQLEENPWNCSCELIALKDWLDSISYSALVGDVVCETPFRLHGRDLDEVSKQELCPRRLISDYEMRPQTPLSPESLHLSQKGTALDVSCILLLLKSMRDVNSQLGDSGPGSPLSYSDVNQE